GSMHSRKHRSQGWPTEPARPDFQAAFQAVADNYALLAPDCTVIDASENYLNGMGADRSDLGAPLLDLLARGGSTPKALLALTRSLKRVVRLRVRDAMPVQCWPSKLP